jgi:single-stranded DNA-binding protein
MNRTILSGRPVADAETGTSDGGKAFDGLAESIVGPYVRKGQKLTVAGRLAPDNYDGADTKYRSFTLVVDEGVLPDRPRSESDQEVEAS